MSVSAVRYIRRMRGGAQSHLMLCSDGHYYVVKFQNNPQHIRVLANEMLAAYLGHHLGVPIPEVEIVDVDESLIEGTRDLHVQLAKGTLRCEPGLQFGSRYVIDPLKGRIFDYMPAEQLDRVRNLDAFAGILVLDKWTGNTDGRQVCFWQLGRERRYSASFIDQGYCFNAGEWTFPDYPLRGVFSFNEVYTWIRDWSSFEPWLSRTECFDQDVIRELAARIPQEWYQGDTMAFSALVERIIARRKLVRSLIDEFRLSPRRPFPGWHDTRQPPRASPSATDHDERYDAKLA